MHEGLNNARREHCCHYHYILYSHRGLSGWSSEPVFQMGPSAKKIGTHRVIQNEQLGGFISVSSCLGCINEPFQKWKHQKWWALKPEPLASIAIIQSALLQNCLKAWHAASPEDTTFCLESAD